MDTRTFALEHLNLAADRLKKEFVTLDEFKIAEDADLEEGAGWIDAVYFVVSKKNPKRGTAWALLLDAAKEFTISTIKRIHECLGVEALDVLATEDLILYADYLNKVKGPFNLDVIEKMYLSSDDFARRCGAQHIIRYP